MFVHDCLSFIQYVFIAGLRRRGIAGAEKRLVRRWIVAAVSMSQVPGGEDTVMNMLWSTFEGPSIRDPVESGRI